MHDARCGKYANDKEVTMFYKFATRNFAGKIARCYLVDYQELPNEVPKKSRVGHHILVVDASGSMYGDISDVKEKVRKMLTLDEYRDSEMLVSLLSYSSVGDLIEHFTRVKVCDIVKSKNTKAQREIGSLKARGATCATQALEAALELAKKGDKDELCAVSLHTDGYFNDPSPSAEFRKVGSLIDEFRGLKNTFVNTIGYRDCCDYPVLEKIAGALSGKCFQARDLKSFYDSIYDTTSLLAGQTAPALYFERSGKHDYQVFVSSDGKVVGGSGDLSVNGVRADAEKHLLRYAEISVDEYERSKADVGWPLVVALAFARAQLAEGKVTAAKYAAVTRMQDLHKHAKALSGEDLAAFAEDLDRLLFSGCPVGASEEFTERSAISVPNLLALLADHRDDFLLDIETFAKSYRRRGLKRVAGKWMKDQLVKPPVRTELRDKEPFVAVSGFDFNRSSATINMMVAQPCKLLKDGAEVKELGGIKLALKDYRQYTLVGDGSVNVDKLLVRVTSKRLHKRLLDAGVISGGYDPKAAVEIDLAGRPLVEYDAKFDRGKYDGLAERLALLHAADKLLGALAKGASADLSAEQVEELGKHCVTPKLYVSTPTANPYTDLQKAIADGEVDVRVGYEVIVGSAEFPVPSDLYSANEFLARWYECEGVADPKKPKMPEWFNKDFKVKHKKLSSRVKIGPVDKLMARVFDEFFGLTSSRLFDTILPAAQSAGLYRAVQGATQEVVEVIADARKGVAEALEAVYTNEVSPLVFYIGSSGLIPDDFGDVAVMMTPDQLLQKYPSAALTKSMKEEGTHYDLGAGTIVTVVRSQEYFSTAKGVERAKQIEAAAVSA